MLILLGKKFTESKSSISTHRYRTLIPLGHTSWTSHWPQNGRGTWWWTRACPHTGGTLYSHPGPWFGWDWAQIWDIVCGAQRERRTMSNISEISLSLSTAGFVCLFFLWNKWMNQQWKLQIRSGSHLKKKIRVNSKIFELRWCCENNVV